MTGFEFGAIVLVRFPFTDRRGSKQRPAVVASSTAYNQVRPDVILMPVTSRIGSGPGFGEIVVSDWQAAGLLKPSAIKPVLFTMERRFAVKVLGRLNERDRSVLGEVLQKIVGW